MKLSMWMIANQLMELDITAEIREDAPAVLNSARLAYATNCVHIYRSGEDVICAGEGGRIIFHNSHVTRVFEVVQSVFDSHEDWISRIQLALKQHEFQMAVDEAVKLLKNPLVLFDVNNKVLGISSAFGPHELDAEWNYLHTYGYSSVNAFKYLRTMAESQSFLHPGMHTYSLSGNQRLGHGGITTPIYWNGTHYGILTLLAKDHRLNPGDRQLLAEFSELLSPVMGALFLQNREENCASIFTNIMQGKNYSQDELALQLAYRNWKADDTYYVTCLEAEGGYSGSTDIRTDTNTLMRMIYQQFTDVVVDATPPYVTILSTHPLYGDPSSTMLLNHIANSNSVRVAFSLPGEGITNIPYLYRQTLFTLRRSLREETKRSIHHFREFSAVYLLTEPAPMEEKIMACMPEVRRLWQKSHQGDDMFRTLKCYLDSERSIAQTAAALYLHRNTAVYRIRKIQEYLRCDLEDSEARNYCLLSVLTLEAFDQR